MKVEKTYSPRQAAKLVASNYQSISEFAKTNKIDAVINPINRRIKITEKGLKQLIAAFGKR